MTNIFLSLFGISVSISLIVIVLILLTPFLNKRYAAKWKYLIWIFLALWLLVPFSGSNGSFVMDMLSQMKTQTLPKSEDTDTPTDVTIPSGRIIVEIPAQMTTPITVQSEKNNVGITLLDIVTFIWMIGSLIFVSVHFISYSHYKRQVIKKGRIIGDTHILRQIFELKCELHIRHTIQAIEYHEAESPMIIGFLKPVLVLPKEQYSSEELFFILKHELVHLKRRDTYFKLLFVTANAVHWFNPFIWIMQKEAAIDMELSCDERVTQGTSYAVRKAYTETLLSMLHNQCAKRTVLSTQFYGGKKIMKKRFKNILLKNRKKNGISILICAVILTISFGTLVGCSIAKEDIGNASAQLKKEEVQEDIQIEQTPRKEFPVIADTFALSIVADDEKNNSSDNVSEYLEAEDCQEIRNIVDEFAAAYFDGNIDAMQKFLASTYEEEIDLYESTGTISDLTVKGLSDADEKKIENGRCIVSLEFRDSSYEDMFLYLTFEFIKQESSWKIQSYGVEG